MSKNLISKIFRRHIALPQDHGAWVFLFSPLLIGLFAGGEWKTASLYLILGALAAFLLRQPVAIAVKVFSGRRGRGDLPAAVFWSGVYALIGLAALAGLAARGFSFVLLLALPGLPVFGWHLWLVSRRAERRQAGVEVVGSGALALAAPAAYWVGRGEADGYGWLLFALVWLQSAASIVYAYLRLEQREWGGIPPVGARLKAARRALLYSGFNTAAALALAAAGVVAPLLWAPFALQFGEVLWGGLLRPAVGIRPTRIGLRQLAVSSLFTLGFILAQQVF